MSYKLEIKSTLFTVLEGTTSYIGGMRTELDGFNI
jgi:hypothetical protein